MKRSLMLLMLVCSFRLLGGCGGGTSTQRMQLQLQGGILPPATAQTPYNTALSLSGGVGPYTWTWAASPSSSLPPGLILGNGDISGTPTTANSYSLIVTVKDSQSPPAQSIATFTIVVIPLTALTIASGTPPIGTIGTAYDGGSGFLLTASGGVAPYTWSWAAAANSSLPPGLSLTSGSISSISGTPTTLGTYNVVVTLTDSGSPAAQKVQPYTMMIDNPPPPIISTSPAPPAGALNTDYAGFTFKASGGLAPLTWGETGALPGGMTLGSDGKLSGTPTATGSFAITVTVQDSLNQNASPQNFTIQVDARAAGFTATGSMGTGRAYHTATLLASREVLVVGGDGSEAGHSAELYDPNKKTFTPTTGKLVVPRTLHTATLLCDLTTALCKNQKVLVTGGLDFNLVPIVDAELYDPATGAFSATGSMQSPRSGHTATLLNDGTVLVSGGGVATAEIYNPNTESFTPVIKPMIDSPRFHTATLLTNGEVLIAGGKAASELFDPVNETFTATANLGTEDGPAATLLKDGKVLLAGGRVFGKYKPPFCNPCYASLSSAQLFETSSASFFATGGMSDARAEPAAALLNDGKVLVTGGDTLTVGFNGQIIKRLSSAELFNPLSGSFALTGAMITARRSHTATLLSDGTVLVIGGLDTQNNYLATAELYQ